MAIEKTAPPAVTHRAPGPVPRVESSRGFQAALEDVLGRTAQDSRLPLPGPAPLPAIPQGGPVHGSIHSMTVAAPIDRQRLGLRTGSVETAPLAPVLAPVIPGETPDTADASPPVRTLKQSLPVPAGAADTAAAQAPASTISGGPPSATARAQQLDRNDENALQAWAMSVKTSSRKAAPAKSPPRQAQKAQSAQASEVQSAAEAAAAQVGKRYLFGGESPRRGFDCSGLTSYAYAQSGLDLPHNSREQFRQGKAVSRDDLRKGDLVFFGKKGVHHVGIYMSDGRFVHAATGGGKVEFGDLDDPVWAGSYAGARRML